MLRKFLFEEGDELEPPTLLSTTNLALLLKIEESEESEERREGGEGGEGGEVKKSCMNPSEFLCCISSLENLTRRAGKRARDSDAELGCSGAERPPLLKLRVRAV